MSKFAKKNLVDWAKLVETELKGGRPDDLIWDTPEGIPIKSVYT